MGILIRTATPGAVTAATVTALVKDVDAGVDDDYRTRVGGYYDDTYRTGI